MAITAYLYYSDVGAALTFLSKAFGLKKSGAAMRDASGTIRHAAMKLGDSQVMMGSPPGRYRNPRRLGQATASLYVDVGNVDRHCARARKAGAKIIEEPAETPYGARRYGAEDPEGQQWYFAQEARKPGVMRKARPRVRR